MLVSVTASSLRRQEARWLFLFLFPFHLLHLHRLSLHPVSNAFVFACIGNRATPGVARPPNNACVCNVSVSLVKRMTFSRFNPVRRRMPSFVSYRRRRSPIQYKSELSARRCVWKRRATGPLKLNIVVLERIRNNFGLVAI